MALSAGKLKLNFTGKHTVTTGIGTSASDASITHAFTVDQDFPNGTSLPATVVGSFTLTLASSTAFIDMNAVPIGNGATADATGLKLQCLAVANRSGNGDLVLSYGTSSPYNFAGTSFNFAMEAGGKFLAFQNDGAADVSTAARYILATGTGTQSFDVMVIAG